MASNTNKRRITFQVDSDLRDKVDKHVPWGQQRVLFETITRSLVDMFEEHDSAIVIGAILSKDVKLTDIVDYPINKRNKNEEI